MCLMSSCKMLWETWINPAAWRRHVLMFSQHCNIDITEGIMMYIVKRLFACIFEDVKGRFINMWICAHWKVGRLNDFKTVHFFLLYISVFPWHKRKINNNNKNKRNTNIKTSLSAKLLFLISVLPLNFKIDASLVQLESYFVLIIFCLFIDYWFLWLL